MVQPGNHSAGLAETQRPSVASKALVVTEPYDQYIRAGKMLSSFLRITGYDVTQVEDYHDVLDQIRLGNWSLVVYAGLHDILQGPAVQEITEAGDTYSQYTYESKDCQIINDMRPDPLVPLPRIIFRSVRGPFAETVWHCLHLPGVALVEDPLRKKIFLSIVADVMR